jgi:arylsulfatase A-like enzyme
LFLVNPNSSRRRFLRTTAIASAAIAVGARSKAQTATLSRKPNLLVFLPDQLRTDAVFGQHANAVHAPNIHRLASESTIFERTYVTHPVCAPSRSSLLSGTWPHMNGCTNNGGVLPRNFVCLPEMLGDSDYRTGYFGKWHLGDEFSAQHGFEEWLSIDEYFKSPSPDHKIEGVSDYTKFLLSKGYKPNKRGKYFTNKFPAKLSFELSKPKFLETRACSFLENHAKEPFILFLAFHEPHPPYSGPLNNEHSLSEISLDPSFDSTFGDEIPLYYRVRQENSRRTVGDAGKFRGIKQRYFGLITEVDRSIGVILAKLEELGLRDRTITVLTSDHGDMMSAQGLLGKEVMFEESAAVPYLIRMPDQTHSIRRSQPLSHIDFVPTMLDLLGKPAHSQCMGKSQSGLIRTDNSTPGMVFLEWAPAVAKRNAELGKLSKLASKENVDRALDQSTRAVVTPNGWKLCLRDKDKNELYNLREDPEERHNLYYDNSHHDIIEELTVEIHRWQEQTDDKLKV